MRRRTSHGPGARQGYGLGSVFQRKADGRWIVRVRRDGKRVQIGSSMTQAEAQAILDHYHAEQAPLLSLSRYRLDRDTNEDRLLDELLVLLVQILEQRQAKRRTRRPGRGS